MVNGLKKIKTVLISVYHKDNLTEIIHAMRENDFTIFSTGGTKDFIESHGVKVNAVEDLTGYPSILDGRVKTLHPKIFGGILSRSDLESHKAQLLEYAIPSFDMVIVDLYPFQETVASKSPEDAIIEKIDIGGISLIRAAAKNYNDVVIISNREQYCELLNIVKNRNCETSLEERRKFAKEAFQVSSEYDTAIFSYFDKDDCSAFKHSEKPANPLRYGENPHQKGIFYGKLDNFFEKLHGRDLSYNNLLDVDAAVNLIDEFKDTGFAILKHNNACGLACRDNLADAWKDALASDPISAFGGVLITNKKVDLDTAREITKIFFEVIIAPGYAPEAFEVLMQKKNRIILVRKEKMLPDNQFRSLLNGVLFQERDVSAATISEMKTVTQTSPSKAELVDLAFANILVKNTKSNAIVLAKNRQLLASGTGQTSRIDALNQAIAKARHFGFSLEGTVMASDAFFPFSDCVQIASEVGVRAIVQPGGSIKDNESIELCNKKNIAMVFTGKRHFKH